MVMTREVDLLARDLARLLNDLTSLHGEMVLHMRGKIEAIKHADSDRITSITAREVVLAQRVAEREGLRRQITARIVKGLGREPQGDPRQKLSVGELAEWLAEPRRSQLLVAAAGLREKLQELERLQRTTSLITSTMLEHLGEVMRVMRGGGKADSYSRSGRCQSGAAACVFEAVG